MPRQPSFTKRAHTFSFIAAITAALLPTHASATQPGVSYPAGSAMESSLSAMTQSPARRSAADEGYPFQENVEYMARRHSMVGTALVVRDKDGSREYTAGVRALNDRVPIQQTDQFRVASVTKLYVASIILQLATEGKVALDAPISRYLPGVIKGSGYNPDAITVRHLLGHRSGIPHWPYSGLQDNFQAKTEQQLVDAATALKPLFTPGQGFTYSNTGYVLLGMLASKVLGQDLPQIIQQRIVIPNGLTGTFFPNSGQRGFTGPYVRGYLNCLFVLCRTDVTAIEPSSLWAAGAMVSTSRDADNFLQNLLDGKVIPLDLLAEMMEDTRPMTSNIDYGLGLQKWRTSCGVEAFGHEGQIVGHHNKQYRTLDGRGVSLIVNTTDNFGNNYHGDAAALADAAICKSGART